MAKAKTKKPEPQNFITIDCIITTPDGNTVSRRRKIINPRGCISGPNLNNPEEVFITLYSGLVKKYGRGHIK